jgi:hypothetical protein
MLCNHAHDMSELLRHVTSASERAVSARSGYLTKAGAEEHDLGDGQEWRISEMLCSARCPPHKSSRPISFINESPKQRPQLASLARSGGGAVDGVVSAAAQSAVDVIAG